MNAEVLTGILFNTQKTSPGIKYLYSSQKKPMKHWVKLNRQKMILVVSC